MGFIKSSKELMNHIATMDQEKKSVKNDIEKNTQLKQMIEESKREYKNGKGMSTSQVISSFSSKDFD